MRKADWANRKNQFTQNTTLKLSQKLTATWYVKNSHLPAGELSSPVDTLDSSSQDNLQSTRTSEVQVQLNHYAEN